MSTLAPRFRILKQGYDRFEVDRVIDNLESQLRETQEKLMAYQNQIVQSQQQIAQLNQKFSQLTQQITIREKAADEINRLALKEANQVIETAVKNADIIVQEALSNARIVLVELARLSDQTTNAKRDMKEKIHSLNTMIDEFKLPEVPQLDWLEFIKKSNE